MVKLKIFHPGNLVCRMRIDARKFKDWKGPFQILSHVKSGAYQFEHLSRKGEFQGYGMSQISSFI